jgi:phage gp45-like
MTALETETQMHPVPAGSEAFLATGGRARRDVVNVVEVRAAVAHASVLRDGESGTYARLARAARRAARCMH